MKRMLIDASHPEETRVVILDGTKIDDFEAETQGKQQLKGNIYIGHVSRVEPSLQAAFITYGGNRNGFLAFGEVHPQFFALKKDEKDALLEEVAAQAARRRGADRDEHDADDAPRATDETPESVAETEAGAAPLDDVTEAEAQPADKKGKGRQPRAKGRGNRKPAPEGTPEPAAVKVGSTTAMTEDERIDAAAAAKAAAMADAAEAGVEGNTQEKQGRGRRPRRNDTRKGDGGAPRRPKRIESRARPQRAEATATDREASRAESRDGRFGNQPIHRRYRIQDVLKEGQKILVQVVKEERGSKGAALTTYFSLPGRYTVLMPNTPYAGGISRKITDQDERRQLRDAYRGLNVPDTMGLIIRTAGLGQEPEHIQRDYANLTNLWQHIVGEFEANDDIQCIHEDGSVIVRALRDMMSDDIEEIIVSGPRAYKMAKDYARNLMPDAVKLIKQHKDDSPLFSAYKVEQKLNHLHHTRVTLPSGGYLIINPTEALVSVDINSGRATQERNIEETALKTNLEACDELARQIRLRDLAGLIVVDFIDMEDNRNVRKVENAMRKALRRDRARIQTANISDFGLMEISRQRLRPSFGESHFVACPHCLGTGFVPSPSTAALMVLRRLEDDDIRGADRVLVTTSTDLVLWLLNNKRDLIRTMEERAKYKLMFRADDAVVAPDFKLELTRIKADGTESTHTIDVTLREQPELPPELRQRGPHRKEREDRDDERKDKREDRTPRDDRKDDRKRTRDHADKDAPEAPPAREAATDAKPEGRPEGEKGERKDGRKDRRPRRLETETGAAAEATPAETVKPKVTKEPAPARPAQPPIVVEDKPLAVQKVEVDAEPVTPVATAPRKKVEIKKQADTDRDDTPLAVAKVTTETGSPEPVETPKKSGGLISRLLSGR